MPNSGLFGPYPLTAAGVTAAVKGVGAGAYALGQTHADNLFYVSYVGRSDDDLATRLQQHVPEPYLQFKYGFYPSAKAAFDKECVLFHDFKPPDNKVHPARPKGTKHSCPVADCDELD
jgi:hypothetical protein